MLKWGIVIETSAHKKTAPTPEHKTGIGRSSSVSLQPDRVLRKPVNANPGLKVNRSIDFSCIKMSFAS